MGPGPSGRVPFAFGRPDGVVDHDRTDPLPPDGPPVDLLDASTHLGIHAPVPATYRTDRRPGGLCHPSDGGTCLAVSLRLFRAGRSPRPRRAPWGRQRGRGRVHGAGKARRPPRASRRLLSLHRLQRGTARRGHGRHLDHSGGEPGSYRPRSIARRTAPARCAPPLPSSLDRSSLRLSSQATSSVETHRPLIRPDRTATTHTGFPGVKCVAHDV